MQHLAPSSKNPLPASLLHPPVEGFPLEQQVYARRLHWHALLVGGAWAAYALGSAARGQRALAALAAVATGMTLLLRAWVLRQHRMERLRLGSHLHAAQFAISLVAAAMLSGQGSSWALWFLSLVPLYVASQEGERAAAVWTGVLAALMATIHATDLLSPRGSTAASGELLLGQLALLLVVLGAAASVRASHDIYAGQLRQQGRAYRERSRSLETTRDQALEATRAKSRFLASMSHEIRTPLNGILGLTSVLMESQLGRDDREMVATIHKSGKHLLDVLNNILDYSKLESDYVVLDKAPFSVRTCVEDVLDLLAPMAHEKGLDLALDLDPKTPPRLMGDVVRVRQVLVNLVGNAVKFTSSGAVVVRVVYEGNEASFAVRDTGPGLTQDEQHRLFRPFQQTLTSRRSKGAGSGLGLVISQRLAELMGGQITVESRVGQGSTFLLRVPLQAITAERSSQPRYVRSPSRLLYLDARDATAAAIEQAARSLDLDPRRATDATLDEQLAWAELLLAPAFPPALLDRVREPVRQGKLQLLLCAPPQAMPAELAELGARRLHWPISRNQMRQLLLAPGTTLLAESDPHLSVPLGATLPLTILVAEDNPVNKMVIERMLKKLGYLPDFAADGLAAVEAAAKRRYDLILMDIQMPVLDGLGASQRIRRELPHQPRIIALTANVLPEMQHACVEAGMDGFLRKPFEPAELIAALQSPPSP